MTDKIFIVSPDTDSELIQNAIKLLSASGKYTVQVEKNTPANLLHIALGIMTGTDGDIPDDTEAAGDENKKDEGDDSTSEIEAAAAASKAPEGESDTDTESSDDSVFNFESLGTVLVDGELVEAYSHAGVGNVLLSSNLTTHGSLVSFIINESVFSHHGTMVEGLLDNTTKMLVNKPIASGLKIFTLEARIEKNTESGARLLVGTRDIVQFK